MRTDPYEAPKGKRLTVAMAVFALMAAALGAYVVAYFSRTQVDRGTTWMIRVFRDRHEARFFWPAFKVEAALCGKEIVMGKYPVGGVDQLAVP